MFKFPKLNKRQLDKLSDIISDIGLISLASVVLPAVFDKPDPLKITLGSILAIICWMVSLHLKR